MTEVKAAFDLKSNILYLCLIHHPPMGSKRSKAKSIEKEPVKEIKQATSGNENLLLIPLLFFTFFIFSSSLKFDFVNWDDDRNAYENPLVPELNLKAIFSQNVIGNYNPLSILSFAIEHHFYGMDSGKMHLVNILLHLLCVFFVFKIFRALDLKLWFAFLGAALFAFHPLRVESVIWITERKDVLYGAFFLPALLLYIRNLDHLKSSRTVLIYFLFLVGLFAKIQMVALPLTMLAIDYYRGRKISFQLITEKWYLFLTAFAFGCLGIYFLNQQGSLETNNSDHTGIQRLFIGSYSFITYLIKWLVPYRMSPLYPYPDKLTLWHYLSLPGMFFICAAAYYAFKQKFVPIVFGFLFFFFNIVFLLQILGAGQGYLADRFTYIAYIGLFFIISYYAQIYLEKNPGSTSTVFSSIGIYLLVLAFLSYNQTKIWKNSATLWTHVLKYYSNTSLPYNNRANYYRDNKQYDLALQDYNNAVKYKAGHATFNSRARLYFNKNEDEKAIIDYNEAIRLSPQAEYFVNRGAAKAKLGRIQEALDDFNKGLEINKNWKFGYLNRSIIYNQLGKFDLALADINSYLKFDPKNADIWYEGGRCLRAISQHQKAIEYYTTAIRLKPNFGLFYLERGRTYEVIGNALAAQQDKEKALALGEKIQ